MLIGGNALFSGGGQLPGSGDVGSVVGGIGMYVLYLCIVCWGFIVFSMV